MRKFLDRYDVDTNGDIYIKGRKLIPYKNNSRGIYYLRIKLVNEYGERKGFYIHRIVAFCYPDLILISPEIERQLNGKSMKDILKSYIDMKPFEIDHINTDTLNCGVDNLMFTTSEENKEKRIFVKNECPF